jgi:hypothetical protein
MLNQNISNQVGESVQPTQTNKKTRLSHPLRTALSLTFALAALASGNEAFACASCGCSLSTDWGSQGVSTATGFSADLSYTYINQDTPIYGSTKNPPSSLINTLYANGQEIETATKTQTVTAAINYNGETWGISVQIPFLDRTHGTNGTTVVPGDLGANYTTSSGSGLGDIRVIGRYSGFSEARTTGLIAGIKLPTGSTNQNFNGGAGAGTPLDAGLQLGTGSTDIIYGAYTSGLISKYGWFVQGTVQHAISPLVTTADGVTTYRPGDTFSLNTGIRYAGFGATVSPMLQLNLVHKNSDEGTNVNNDVLTGAPISSGSLAYLAPGVSVRLGGGSSVYGFVQIPVCENVGSLQLVPKFTATIGVHHLFQ